MTPDKLEQIKAMTPGELREGARRLRADPAFEGLLWHLGDELRRVVMATKPDDPQHIEAWHQYRALGRLHGTIDLKAKMQQDEDQANG